MKLFTACRRSVKLGCNKKGLPRGHKACCGKSYAIKSMAERHNKVYHGGDYE